MATDKSALRDELLALLQREHDTLVAAQRASQEGAVHAESRAEGDKDMRATEASYLARGQAQRVAALSSELQRLAALELQRFEPGDAIAASALVTLSSSRGRRTVFLVPAAAGAVLETEVGKVHVVTPASPLGSALLGAGVGDEVEVERGDEVQEYRVVALE